MKTIVKAAPDIKEKDLITLIHRSAEGGEVIYAGRNRLVATDFCGSRVVVKQFASGTKKRLVYAVFKSKAHKSFCNATELLVRGIDTPQPVGYVEIRGTSNTLVDSYYICKYDDKMSLIDALQEYGRPCLSAFAAFVALLHEKGVVHKDLNNTNVRVAYGEGNFSFSLIDLNRMTISPKGKSVSPGVRFKNLCRFSSYDDDFVFFLREYLRYANLPDTLLPKAISAKKRHDAHVDFKKKLKHPFRKHETNLKD